MAKRIIWSFKAQNDRKAILNYWINRNKSKTYSKRLNNLFIEAIKIISIFPEIGKKTDTPGVRIKIVKDYLIFYEIEKASILILSIWDNRRDPEKLDEGGNSSSQS